MSRLRWDEICRRETYRGRWVALDDCSYDEATGRATEGAVIDVDDDLVELCTRVRESETRNCEILYCEEECAQQRSSSPDPFRRDAN